MSQQDHCPHPASRHPCDANGLLLRRVGQRSEDGHRARGGCFGGHPRLLDDRSNDCLRPARNCSGQGSRSDDRLCADRDVRRGLARRGPKRMRHPQRHAEPRPHGNRTSTAVQIDHVVSLGDAWRTGAQQLTGAQRVALANDPINLFAVDARSNAQKRDATPRPGSPYPSPFGAST